MVIQFQKNKIQAVFSLTAFFFLFFSPLTDEPVAQFFSDTVSPPDGSINPDTRTSADPFVAHAGDSSIPRPIKLAWKLRGSYRDPSYDVYLSEQRRFHSTDIFAHDITETTFIPLQVKKSMNLTDWEKQET